MKCIHHPDQDAVGACSVCGVSLCKSCFEYYQLHECNNCVRSALGQVLKAKKTYLYGMIISLIISFIVLIFLIDEDIVNRIILSFAVALGISAFIGLIIKTKLEEESKRLLHWWFNLVFCLILGIVAFPMRLFYYFQLSKRSKMLYNNIMNHPEHF